MNAAKTLSGLLATAAVLVLGADAVEAGPYALKCKGPLQIIRGQGAIATPFCQDNYLAKIAREAGMKVTGRAVRENPNLKTDVCIFVGYDIRVSDICIGYMPEDAGRRH